MREKGGKKMSIFDRFLSKEAGGQKRSAFFPTSTREIYNRLNEEAAAAKARCPEDAKTIDDFVWALKEACSARNKKAQEGDPGPMKAEGRFFLSGDRLTAYACLIPPENGGEELTLEAFLGDLHYEGVVYGVLEQSIPEDFSQGYYHLFPIARGSSPQPGEDGEVTELFQRRKHMRLEVQNGSEVDFAQDAPLQPIRKGSVICRIAPPKPGVDGRDVTGLVLPCPEAASAFVPQGKNVLLSADGLSLTAGVDGILYIENEQFCIQEQKIIDGDLTHFQGTLQITGNLYIGGSVDGGVDVKATGDIVINGRVGQARVASLEGIIRVQQGVYGTEGGTLLAAAKQVQSPVIEWAEVAAGTSVIAETISGSTIHCNGTVYAMTGRGMIANSTIRAGESVLCLRVGNIAGGRSRFSVGYPPDVPESLERLTAELNTSRATLEKMWGTISELSKKGTRITEREKMVLDQLVEQRALYLKRLDTLKVELRAVNKALEKRSRGRVRCEKLYPFLEVRIGRLKEEITTTEEGCNIHVEDGCIQLK